MTRRRVLQAVAAVVTVGLIAWAVSTGLERLVSPQVEAPSGSTASPEPETAHITATLFYASPDGQALVPARREVPLAEGVVAQGRAILMAQLEQQAPDTLVSVVPPGTTQRAFYVTERGDAFVDLSAELARAHPGGSLTEMLTVYSLVNAVTANLPAVRRVQLLVDGHEVDTLAGHVDIRRPLMPDTSLVREATTGVPAPPSANPAAPGNRPPPSPDSR